MSDMPPVTARQSFPNRVAARAAEVQFARILLTVLAFPFYLVGLVVGLALVAVRWCWAAVEIGIADVRKRGADAG